MNQDNLFSKSENEDKKIAREKLLKEQKAFYENTILPIVNELTEDFQGDNLSDKSTVLKINSLY